MNQQFLITKEEATARLDKFLTVRLKKFSRAQVQKLIAQGTILINDKPAKAKYLLKPGDRVTALIPDSIPFPLSLEPDSSIPLDVVYEDRDVVVINKPAGLVVHPSHSTPKGTLANALLARFPEIANVGEDPLRPGIVHRLDKDTSGLMIAAKNNHAFQFLKNQFQHRKVVKKYVALVSGKIKKTRGTISAPIARLKTKQVIAERIRDKTRAQKERPAITEYEVVKYLDDYTLVSAFPKTGRMHQLRVHFAFIGHPIVGDQKYGLKRDRKLLSRQFLHAAELTLQLPNGKIKTLSAPLSYDLQELLSSGKLDKL